VVVSQVVLLCGRCWQVAGGWRLAPLAHWPAVAAKFCLWDRSVVQLHPYRCIRTVEARQETAHRRRPPVSAQLWGAFAMDSALISALAKGRQAHCLLGYRVQEVNGVVYCRPAASRRAGAAPCLCEPHAGWWRVGDTHILLHGVLSSQALASASAAGMLLRLHLFVSIWAVHAIMRPCGPDSSVNL
jgi:hypothetical protein